MAWKLVGESWTDLDGSLIQRATYAARLTPELPAAIATLAIHGPRALEIFQSCVQLCTKVPQVDYIYYGTWRLEASTASTQPPSTQLPSTQFPSTQFPSTQFPSPQTASEITASEQVVCCRTDVDTIEIHCHGGTAICDALLRDLQSAGCELVLDARWRELANSLTQSPIEAAAEAQLLRATTDRTAAILLDQRDGCLDRAVDALRDSLRKGASELARSKLDELLGWSGLGLHLTQPWYIVLAGPPNVGKSSLINAVAGQQQSIVHHEPGTTRDWVESRCAVQGWPMCFCDTAGVRTSDNEIELAGAARAQQQLDLADLVIFVVDATQGWTPVHTKLRQRCLARGARTLIAWNKSDLDGAKARPSSIESVPCVACSTHAPPGILELLEQIVESLIPLAPADASAVPFLETQVASLEAAGEALARRNFAEALAALSRF